MRLVLIAWTAKGRLSSSSSDPSSVVETSELCDGRLRCCGVEKDDPMVLEGVDGGRIWRVLFDASAPMVLAWLNVVCVLFLIKSSALSSWASHVLVAATDFSAPRSSHDLELLRSLPVNK
jgi:hypothetical protein